MWVNDGDGHGPDSSRPYIRTDPFSASMRRLSAAACLLPVVLGGCLLGSSRQARYPEAPLTLAEARARWAATAPASYVLVYDRACLLCSVDARGPFRVTVEGGRVADARPVGLAAQTLSSARLDSVRTAYGMRVEDAFDLLEAAYRRGADVVRVAYEPYFGYPLTLYIDDDGRAGRDPLGLHVTGFTPGSSAASAPSN